MRKLGIFSLVGLVAFFYAFGIAGAVTGNDHGTMPSVKGPGDSAQTPTEVCDTHDVDGNGDDLCPPPTDANPHVALWSCEALVFDPEPGSIAKVTVEINGVPHTGNYVTGPDRRVIVPLSEWTQGVADVQARAQLPDVFPGVWTAFVSMHCGVPVTTTTTTQPAPPVVIPPPATTTKVPGPAPVVTPPTDVCSNIAGNQVKAADGTITGGYVDNGDGTCSMPNTGSGDVIPFTLIGLGTVAAGGFSIWKAPKLRNGFRKQG